MEDFREASGVSARLALGTSVLSMVRQAMANPIDVKNADIQMRRGNVVRRLSLQEATASIKSSTIGFGRSLRWLMCVAVLCLALLGSRVEAFQAPLESPAIHNDLAVRSPLLDVVAVGGRIVAVGLRGGVVLSDDAGQSWEQADVPVSTDLVALSFVGERKGWAVGHGGVVLHTSDGGATWKKQLDGIQAARLAIDYYASNQAGIEDAQTQKLLEREQSLAVEGETQPFMDVLFVDELNGYVVGTFNRIFVTTDGGESWAPLMHLTDNPGELHFYTIAGGGDQLYLAGERGRVWRYDSVTGRFVAADTPYDGTLFGILPFDEQSLLAYGMRGSLYLSRDRGESWSEVESSANAGVTAAIELPDGRLLIVDQGGGIAQSSDGGETFTPLLISQPMPYFGAAYMTAGELVLVGVRGIRVETI